MFLTRLTIRGVLVQNGACSETFHVHSALGIRIGVSVSHGRMFVVYNYLAPMLENGYYI